MLNFTVGPVMMDEEILKIGSEQIPYFRTEEFSELIIENENLLMQCVNAPPSSRTIFLTGSGTAAMEATVMNLFTKEDKVLVVNGGSFGKRFKQICDIHCIKSDEIKLDYFSPLLEEHLAPFENRGYTGFLINVHETSTGVLYNMKLVSEFCKRNNLLLVVDAISSFLADPFDMKMFGVNVTIISSQKALALPPGMSYIIVDLKAQEIMYRNYTKSMYFNLKEYLANGERGQTPFTPAVSNLIQLNKRLHSIINKGINNIINDVSKLAEDFRFRIKNLPLEIATSYPSNALTPLKPNGKISAIQIFKFLKNNYNILVTPNGGDLAEVIFRVGHIGNINIDMNNILIDSLRSILNKL